MAICAADCVSALCRGRPMVSEYIVLGQGGPSRGNWNPSHISVLAGMCIICAVAADLLVGSVPDLLAPVSTVN
jgi:hypothetical protein